MENISIPRQDIDTVIYHKNCSDGFGAAWAAHEFLKHQAEYLPAQYENIDFVYKLKNRTIAVLDFSFDEATIKKIISNGNKICIIDHHKTAERIRHLPNVHIDSTHSGAILAWNFFHPAKDPPEFLLYIEDRDLWKWKMEKSSEFSIVFQDVPKKFENYSKFKSYNKIKETIKTGEQLKSYQFSLIKRISSRHINTKWNGTNIKIVNSPILQSEIGNFLSSDSSAALIWYKNYQANKIIVSLRSKGDLDVSKIAERFNGGGHKNAAGFTLDLNQNLEEYFEIDNQ